MIHLDANTKYMPVQRRHPRTGRTETVYRPINPVIVLGDGDPYEDRIETAAEITREINLDPPLGGHGDGVSKRHFRDFSLGRGSRDREF